MLDFGEWMRTRLGTFKFLGFRAKSFAANLGDHKPALQAGRKVSAASLDGVEISVISQFFWPELIGTAPYVTDLAKWFGERGASVTVVTSRPFYPEFRLTPGYEAGKKDREMVDGVSVFRLPTYIPTAGRALGRIVNEVYFLVGTVSRLVVGKIRQSDYVVTFSPSIMAVLAGVSARRRHGKHLAVIHDIQSGLAAGLGMVRSNQLIRLMQFVERFILNRADHIIVLSEKMKHTLQENGVHRPIEVLPIWVDPEKIYPISLKRNRTPVVVYSGNLGRKQGLHQVLALAEILLAERPDVRVVIRGSGTQFDVVQRQIKERGLKNVELGPLLPPENLNELLAEGDVHLVPQNPDAADFAMPSKVYGIMAAGRPFVCTALPGSTLWALQEETDALICSPPNDARAFADAVIGLLDHPGRRAAMGARGRTYVEQQAAREAVLARYAASLFGRKSLFP